MISPQTKGETGKQTGENTSLGSPSTSKRKRAKKSLGDEGREVILDETVKGAQGSPMDNSCEKTNHKRTKKQKGEELEGERDKEKAKGQGLEEGGMVSPLKSKRTKGKDGPVLKTEKEREEEKEQKEGARETPQSTPRKRKKEGDHVTIDEKEREKNKDQKEEELETPRKSRRIKEKKVDNDVKTDVKQGKHNKSAEKGKEINLREATNGRENGDIEETGEFTDKVNEVVESMGGQIEVVESMGNQIKVGNRKMTREIVKKPSVNTDLSLEAVDEAVTLLKKRLVGGLYSVGEDVYLLPEMAKYEKRLEAMLTQTVETAFNHSMLLLGPRGCGKTLIVERVLAKLEHRFPGKVSSVRLNGLFHSDERTALKEIARQLCLDQSLVLSTTASFDDNLRFLTDMLHEFSNSQRAIIFVLDEFDLFANSAKQSLLYNLFDALHSDSVQASVLGISCRLDADQLLEKRVRSRFSNRKMLFLPPTYEDAVGLLEQIFLLPEPPKFGHKKYSMFFNKSFTNLLQLPETKSLIERCLSLNGSTQSLLDWSFRALCAMKRTPGKLSLENFKIASRLLFQQPRLSLLRDVSVLELFIIVALKRLEAKEIPSCNFDMIYTEYEKLRDMASVGVVYSRPMALRAFEHLLTREILSFTENRGDPCALLPFRSVYLLVAPPEIYAAMKLHPSCPEILKQWFSRETINKAIHTS